MQHVGAWTYKRLPPGNFHTNIRKSIIRIRRGMLYLLAGSFLFSLTLVALLPVLADPLFFHMPSGPTTVFDCDDATLVMLQRFSSVGIKAVPILGNLKVSGEKYQEIDHVWVLAQIGGIKVAFDWGAPWLDKQHYEGFPITYDQLVGFVEQDK